MSTNRRNFIKQLGGSTALLTASSLSSFAAKERYETRMLHAGKKISANSKIRIATIGMGIMGYNDTNTALKVPGVELVACCDLYNGRLDRAKELYGPQIAVTRHYEEILDRKDIDAVIVATSDNWHSKISIEAMHKGKAVYSEKPMVHKIEQGWDVINAQKATKAVMQIGSQHISSIVAAKAKEQFEAGAIGQINSVEAFFDRQSALGAWEYTMPLDSSPQTVDWERYQALAKNKTPYDEKKFFWWRNYRECGTGVAGDLFVHLLTLLHFITSSKGPKKIFSLGGLTYWKDGRDVPDVMNAILEYPETPQHSAFQVSLRVNFVSGTGGGGSVKLVGTEGVMEASGDTLSIQRHKMPKAPGYGDWDALGTYPVAMQKKIIEAYNNKWDKDSQTAPKLPDITYQVPEGYDEHVEHFTNFFEGVRSDKILIEDPIFAFRAAAPCLLCNESYFQQKVILWDAENMKLHG
jgi:predicted dehydrogenase